MNQLKEDVARCMVCGWPLQDDMTKGCTLFADGTPNCSMRPRPSPTYAEKLAHERRNRPFPIQGGFRIPWWAAERAYKTYARHFGTDQSLERLAQRGGFGLTEWGLLYAGLNPCHDWGGRAENETARALRDVVASFHDAPGSLPANEKAASKES